MVCFSHGIGLMLFECTLSMSRCRTGMITGCVMNHEGAACAYENPDGKQAPG